MTLREMQQWVKEDWEKSPHRPDAKQEFMYLFEEIGEMCEAIRKREGAKEHKSMDADLEEESGDAFICFLTILIREGVDLQSAFEKSRNKILNRRKRIAAEKGEGK